jgi:predicted transcriptional regulator of viral defense system
MSIITDRNTDKLSVLLKQDRKLFRINDLALLWQISNRDTLRQTISRFIKKGVLIQISRGFYSTIPIKDLDQFELGTSAIHDFCYLSTETVLVLNGIIFQEIMYDTYCSRKRRRINIHNLPIFSRRLDDKYLYNPLGVIDKGKYKIATTERAVADIEHFNPNYYFDGHNIINWKLVSEIKKGVYNI